ncbi:MAG: 4Fe-4S binding protein [Spirochaetia bacterium]|jgi:Fe-S-cluster-containing hydrogenase component 2|nr:4Fe-4S binding protein [Spirochaetia bacterium]
MDNNGACIDEAYDCLRKHLDGLPIGFPKAAAGVRFLRRLFSPEEARLALALDWHFRTLPEIMAALAVLDAGGLPADAAAVEGMLKEMASKGCLLWRQTQGSWALMPFVVGMFEMQIARLTKPLYDDAVDYLKTGFGLELLTTGEAQSRIIPIGAAIRPEHRIADYDEFRRLIRNAGGRIAVLDCICRRGADMAGRPCKATDRRELCMVFRDYADTVLREGWGRALSTEEALEMAELNQREGLIMRPSNEQEPQFLCACCGDCCGLVGVVKAMKRPADFVATNFRARVDSDSCTGCGACARICPMEAIELTGKPALSRTAVGVAGKKATRLAKVLESRCIGCGVCVGACRFGAVVLERLDRVSEPPRNTEELMERLAASRPGNFTKYSRGIRGLLGLPVPKPGQRPWWTPGRIPGQKPGRKSGQ